MSSYSVAIVGSGPSGFYAAGALLAAANADVRVDVYDRLATPWGLVRAGVAPDHPKIKSVSTQFEKIASREGFRFFGNVELGTHVTREELLERYDAVVYAVGAQTERPLGIPGEDLPGSHASVEFVGWYNGHPDYRDLEVDLSADHAVVVGNGNVALDVARMLCLPHTELALTDVADHALHALEKSSVREVVVLGRRGPAQAAFSTTELKDLDAVEGLAVDVALTETATGGDLQDPRMPPAVQRNLELVRRWARQSREETATRRIAFRFHRSPVEIRGEGRVEEVVLAVNELRADAEGQFVAVDTGVREVVTAGLVIRAVGYRGVRLAGLPFDQARGVVRNEEGRIEGRKNEYVVGWIKRGPSGIIGVNRQDANETVRHLLSDLHSLPARGTDPDEVAAWLRRRQPQLITSAGWKLIDHHERTHGQTSGRPRVKLVSTDDLLTVAVNGRTGNQP